MYDFKVCESHAWHLMIPCSLGTCFDAVAPLWPFRFSLQVVESGVMEDLINMFYSSTDSERQVRRGL